MTSFRFGGKQGSRFTLHDEEDLVVIRTNRRGARRDISPLTRRSRSIVAELEPLFGFSSAGVGVWKAPKGSSEELADLLKQDPEIQFGGRGLRDHFGAPVVYTENLFVKFDGEASEAECEAVLGNARLSVKERLRYARNAYFVGAPEGSGRMVFEVADQLLQRADVELCHPELVREVSFNRAFPQQWHLLKTEVEGKTIDAHANVKAAWAITEGSGRVIAVIDDGVDIDHDEFASRDKLVGPFSFAPPRSNDPRPADGDNHGTACAGVACGDGSRGASGVAPRSRLMPLRMSPGLGSQGEADAFAWAADQGADVISCSWGPVDGEWWNPDDPVHDQVVPLPDSTRLAIDYAVETGRGGRGCVITWAAGNGNESVDNDGYASYEKVVAVAACNDESKKSAYSDFGDAIWCAFPSNHGEPSLTPGIWTTDRTGREGYNPGNVTLGDRAGNYTDSFGGTSSACPGVAGVAALILAANPNLRWDEVKEVIRETSDRIDTEGGQYDESGRSPLYGYGRVNAEAAVKLISSSATSY